MSRLLDLTRSWRRQRARVRLCEDLGLTWGRGIVVLSALLWLDRGLLLPRNLRYAFWLSGAAVLAWALGRAVWRAGRGNVWSAVLEEAAREFPELRPFLRPAWELRGQGCAHTSEQLAQAHLSATEEALAGLPQRPAFRWIPSRKWKLSAAAALVGLATWPWTAGASWERVLAPWRDMPLERFLAVHPGDAVWDLGRPAEISVRRLPGRQGGPASSLDTQLWLRTSGDWRPAPWERQSAQEAYFTVASVAEPLSYRISWRGLDSRVYALTPQSLPRLESLYARINGQDAAVPLSGSEPLTARRGSWVRICGRPNQALARAFLRASFLPVPIALRPGTPGEVAAGFFVRQDGSFQLDLETRDGRRDPAPVVYTLQAVKDEAPTAELLSPQQAVQASPTGMLPVAYAVRDDSGLSRAALLVKPAGGPETETRLQAFAVRKGGLKEFIGDYPWELAGFKPGTKIEFRVKAYDDAVPAQSGVSEPGRLEIVDFEAGHRLAQARWDQAESALDRTARHEETVFGLYAAGQTELARRESSGLEPEWKESAAGMESLSQAMEQDAYANPGLRQQFAGLAQDLRQAQSQGLPAAMAAGEKGDNPSARDRHRRLAQVLRRAQAQLKKGRSVQDLQDIYNRSGNMSRDGERISESLAAMAADKSAKFPAETLRRVQESLERLREKVESLSRLIASLPRVQPGSSEERSRRTYSMPLLQAQTSADALRQALRAGDMKLAAQIAQELAQQLAAIEAAVSAAAGAGMSAASGPAKSSARWERLQGQWAQVVEEQTRLAELSSGMEERRRARFVQEQKELLAGLAAEESALLSSATARTRDLPPGTLPAMQAARDEFASGRVLRAPEFLRTAIAGFREAAQRPAGLPGAMSWFASAQEAIARRLSGAPSAPEPDGPRDETASAARRQSQVRAQTASLQQELESVMEEAGASASEAADKLSAAQEEQKSAEGDMAQGDSGGALGHQQKVLELLDQGGRGLAQAASGSQHIELGIGSGFARPATGVRGSAPGGARLEFVPLPSAKDYQPPKEIREELERSLKEGRPQAYDRIIKEYFKRISQ
ncbi:MAG: hypothetical protein WC881_00970 [Elusimicrobiota bacterium]|jgi:hypothetical protein